MSALKYWDSGSSTWKVVAGVAAGLPTGGTGSQVLSKIDGTDYNTQWTTLSGGGNVSNTGTPTSGQYARWTGATNIEGVAPSTVKTDLALTNADVGLSAVTNDAQIKAADFPASSVNSEVALFSSTTGKVLKRATGSGLAKLASGVLGVATSGTDYEVPLTFSNYLVRTANAVTFDNDAIFTVNNYGTFIRTDATNGATTCFVIDHETSLTPANGIGTTLQFQAPTSTSTAQLLARISNSWTDVTHASRTSQMALQVYNNATFINKLIVFGGGGVALAGSTVDPGLNNCNLPSTGEYQVNSKSVCVYNNASTAAQGPGFATDTYLTGSVITLAAGQWVAGGQYKCVFDMAKTAAGVVALQINVRIGTAGTTADTAVVNWVSSVAQTAFSDQGRFEVLLNIRSIATPTAATIIGVINIVRLSAAAAGFLNAAYQCLTASAVATTTFNSTTATKIGVSFNGGTSFSGTVQSVQAEYKQ